MPAASFGFPTLSRNSGLSTICLSGRPHHLPLPVRLLPVLQ
jgi:hypothetical protein